MFEALAAATSIGGCVAIASGMVAEATAWTGSAAGLSEDLRILIRAAVIEVARNGDGTGSLFTTMIDADSALEAGYDDLSLPGLASLYRELSYNDPAYRDRRGSSRDRNTELILADPL